MPANPLPSIPGAPPTAPHAPIRLAALHFEPSPAPPKPAAAAHISAHPSPDTTPASPQPLPATSQPAHAHSEPTPLAPAHPTSATPPPTHPTPLIPGLPADHRAIRYKITHEKLLEEFLHADIHLPDFARNHFLTLADLASWHDAPQTQADLATYRRIAHSQARTVRALARPEALARLTSQLRSQDFDERHQHLDPNNPKDRALALRQRESARRAATTLLARSKPRRSTKRSHRANNSATTNAPTGPARTTQPHTNQARDAQSPTNQKPTGQTQTATTQQPSPVASIPAESEAAPRNINDPARLIEFARIMYAAGQLEQAVSRLDAAEALLRSAGPGDKPNDEANIQLIRDVETLRTTIRGALTP